MLLPSAPSARGPGHFCLTLHVAMQLGLYLPGPQRALSGVQSLRGHSRSQRTSLLIVRTRRIFTAEKTASSAGYIGVSSKQPDLKTARFTVSRRSEPSSRTALMGEQPNPWDLLQPQDATSRHRTYLHRFRWRRLCLHPARPKGEGSACCGNRRLARVASRMCHLGSFEPQSLRGHCGSLYLNSFSR